MTAPRPLARRLRLAAAAYRFRESLFLLPAVIMACGIALAVLAEAADDALGDDVSVPLTLSMSSNAATWLLATVAGAMITTVGVVFSLTVVSLQLASSQFSPRVMRSFVRDRLSQTVIGLLVGTFFYCVLTLPQMSGDPTTLAPRFSLTVAVVLTLVTVVAIIAHLDHLAQRLQVGRVVRAITGEGERVVADMEDLPSGLRAAEDLEVEPPERRSVVPAAASGWISQVDVALLLAHVPPRTTLRLETRVGAYIHAGEPLVSAWPPVDDGALRALGSAIRISDTRTMQEDVDFAIRQLVDIGLRALSAAINDPTTAVESVLAIGTLLRRVLTRPLAPAVLVDGSDRVLVRPWDLDHDEYVEHAFDQLRQAAVGQPRVAGAILRVLRMLALHVSEEGRPERVPALRRQMEMLVDGVRAAPGLHPADVRAVEALMSDETDPADHTRHG